MNVTSNTRTESLSPQDIDRIHEASMEVFETIGVRVDSSEAAGIFERAGATVEFDGKQTIVKVPRRIVEECLEAAPKDFTIYGRIPERNFEACRGNVGFTTFGECVKTIDPETREVRDTGKADVGGITKVADYYDGIVAIERPCCSLEYRPEIQPVHNLDAMIRNTSKPIFIAAVNRRNVGVMADLAEAAVGGKEHFAKQPFLYIFVCPVSPLHLAEDCGEVIIESAKRGLGIAVIPMALSGATSVATPAGTLVTHNVETLAAIVLAQLVRKGTPCVYATMSTIMDLKHMISACGSPEHALLSSAVAKLAGERYHLPTWTGCGVSDSKLPDAQAGYEYAVNATTAALAGANIVMGAGALESGLITDYAKLVMDCEAQRYIRRILQGIDVSEETLALDVIKKRGPGSEFLGDRHTLRHMREQVQVTVFDRRPRSAWEQAGALPAHEAAYKKAAEILKNHRVAPLHEGAEAAMDEIIRNYEEKLKTEGK